MGGILKVWKAAAWWRLVGLFAACDEACRHYSGLIDPFGAVRTGFLKAVLLTQDKSLLLFSLSFTQSPPLQSNQVQVFSSTKTWWVRDSVVL